MTGLLQKKILGTDILFWLITKGSNYTKKETLNDWAVKLVVIKN
jgi:hypothetical protein